MAFPSNPVDRQIYKDYRFNINVGAWRKYEYYGMYEESAGSSALDIIQKNPNTNVNGFYWIKPQGYSQPELFNCDMTTDGGGWICFGSTENHNLVNINDGVHVINVMTDADINRYENIKHIFSENSISTDWYFRTQADDSTNPTTITYCLKSDTSITTVVTVGYGANNTVLSMNFSTGYTRLYCSGSTIDSNTCGQLNKPAYKTYSPDNFIKEIRIDPRGDGALAHSDEWRRNNTTLTGTKLLYMFR